MSRYITAEEVELQVKIEQASKNKKSPSGQFHANWKQELIRKGEWKLPIENKQTVNKSRHVKRTIAKKKIVNNG